MDGKVDMDRVRLLEGEVEQLTHELTILAICLLATVTVVSVLWWEQCRRT